MAAGSAAPIRGEWATLWATRELQVIEKANPEGRSLFSESIPNRFVERLR